MNTEKTTPPAAVLSTAWLERLEDAVGSYWDCAYQEGHLNRPDGDKANEILHEIRCAVQALVAAERDRARALIQECRSALAEELAGWDLDPPLQHVKQAHDRCDAWLRSNAKLSWRGAIRS